MTRVLYLYNRIKEKELRDVTEGKDHDDHFFGMLRLPKYGIETKYLEIEQFLPQPVARFLRRHVLNIHFVHVPLFPLFLKYDIVFTSTAFGSLFLKTILRIKKPKWVLLDYNLTGLIGNRRTLKQKLLHYLVSYVDAIVTITRGEGDALRALFPKKNITFIHLGTDLEFFKPIICKEENFILSVGRDPGRDYKTLFEAVRDIDIEVKITARPNQLRGLEPIPKNVTIHDFTPQELVMQYARAKLIILPLKVKNTQGYDTMGCSSLVEAMATGKAIIATRTKTMESYIKNSINGILISPNEPQLLKDEIKKLLSNEQERKDLGTSARSFVVERCSAESFSQELATYLKSI